ncbi:MAG: GNAT family N-acetyltransferase [Ardenticatenaceae bacterium]|nr:GNAT family N-acetyltransferase [Ardenticatenaceae bacterium]
MTVTIREARRVELPSLFERTIETSWNDLPPALRTRTSRRELEGQIRRLIDRLLAGGESTFLVAEDADGRNVGHVWLGETTEAFSGERRGYIYDLYVVPEARRRGVARALMAAAEDLARRRGYREIGLTVATHNDAARHLYESLGYLPERLLLTRPLE